MHMLICDDDARFAARVEQLVRACLGQREIPAEIVVCTSGEEALAVPDLELYQVARCPRSTHSDAGMGWAPCLP